MFALRTYRVSSVTHVFSHVFVVVIVLPQAKITYSFQCTRIRCIRGLNMLHCMHEIGESIQKNEKKKKCSENGWRQWLFADCRAFMFYTDLQCVFDAMCERERAHAKHTECQRFIVSCGNLRKMMANSQFR